MIERTYSIGMCSVEGAGRKNITNLYKEYGKKAMLNLSYVHRYLMDYGVNRLVNENFKFLPSSRREISQNIEKYD